MNSAKLSMVLAAWLVFTVFLCVAVHSWARIDPAQPPSEEVSGWFLASIEATVSGETAPTPPTSGINAAFESPVLVSAWHRGKHFRTIEGKTDLKRTLDVVRRRIDEDPYLQKVKKQIQWTVTYSLGEGPVLRGLPWVSEMNLVPLREALVARLGGETAYVLPDEMIVERRLDRGVIVEWIPDMSFGVDIESLEKRLAKKLKTDHATLMKRGTVRRFAAHSVSAATYPGNDTVTEQSIRQAAVDAAKFLLRHQQKSGAYTYLYDGHRGRKRPAGYNLPRHSGTTYFLAQMDHLHDMPEAREGALRALSWLKKRRIHECGSAEEWCVSARDQVEVGSAALTVVAAAELLAKAPDDLAEEMVVKLTAFLRAQQRPDGEIMHEYDIRSKERIDVQRMYYSGETAFALFRAYKVLGDERNLEAAKRLMVHLTGSGWDFFGSRYYYGEEHWTCIAAGEARDYIDEAMAKKALDFCDRWAVFSEGMQLDETQTPWDSEGGYSVGPFLVPRVAAVGSRTEAFVGTYLLAQKYGGRTDHLEKLIEDGLGFLLRWRWAPGPVHLFADPEGAYGGVPNTPVDLDARNDIAQHAGSAWIRWADVLARDKGARELTSKKPGDMSLARN